MLFVRYMGEKDTHICALEFMFPFFISILCVYLFVRHINHAAHPFIAPRLVYGKGFGTVNIMSMIYGGVTSGAVSLLPLYAANRYGINALDSGTLLIAQGAAAIILSVSA